MRSYGSWGRNVAWSLLAIVTVGSSLLILAPTVALAASLSVLPASGSHAVGTTFTATVSVQSNGTPLNAVSGVLSFPSDRLEVVSLSKGGSIITLWIQEPSFSNAAGTVQFEGVVPSPGYSGVSGTVLNVLFRVKAEGQSNLTFTSGSVLANDGEGTEVLQNKAGAVYVLPPAVVTTPITVSPAPPPAETTPAGAKKAPLPTLVSATHPQDTWSTSTRGTFTFEHASDVIAMRLLLDTKPATTPVVTYVPALATKVIDDLEEGVSYLHVQYKTAAGWGDVLHYKLQIDTNAPEPFTVKEAAPGIFAFETTDVLSGIDRYDIVIDGGEAFTFNDDGSHRYTAAGLQPGQHTIKITAIDKAGNRTEAETAFTVAATALTEGTTSTAETAEVAPSAESFIVSRSLFAVALLSVVVPLVALVMLLGWLLYLAWRALGGMRRKIDAELSAARCAVHQTFVEMRATFEDDIEMLRKASVKRKLTREESKILKHLQQNIDQAEAAITKEIDDIEQ